MPLSALTAAPGADLTAEMLRNARELCADGARLLWIGLPTQRNSVLQRLVRDGPLTGFEFISEQQLCYRLLSRARRLKPLKVGTERLALVGSALAEVQQAVPLPGEARLFASAIAELKRHSLTPADSRALAFDAESTRLADVHERYEALKGETWDYDDYRAAALALAESGGADTGADAILVAGYRELLPMTARLYARLARDIDVRLLLPELPHELAHAAPMTAAESATGSRLTCLRAPNEVEEARWVLRDMKRELAGGTDMRDMVLVVPRSELRAYESLAEEYGLPLTSELPLTLAENPAGRTLLELIGVTDFTSPSALLALPGLGRLAAAAIEQRIAGAEPLLRLAARLDRQAQEAAAEQDGGPEAEQLEVTLRNWLSQLETDDYGLEWAERLLDLVIAEILPGRTPAGFDATVFRAQALQRAREAAQLGHGASFRAWWAGLLQDTRLPVRGKVGIALITPELASGRRYRKAWLAAALEGNYLPGSAEDYFLPEELRRPGGLPPRFSGSEQLMLAEFHGLADEIVVTWAESSQGGINTPQAGLADRDAAPVPAQPAGNPAELGQGHTPVIGHQLAASLVTLPPPEVGWLMRYGDCPHRAWAEDLLQQTGDLPPPEPNHWQRLRRELTRAGQLDEAALAALAERHDWAADWLQQHSGLLLRLRYGLRLPQGQETVARIDASGRIDGVVSLYRFCGPDEALDPYGAKELFARRFPERWLANYLLEEAQRREPEVRLYAWPLLHEPVAVEEFSGRWLRSRLGPLEDHLTRLRAGDIAPQPGFRQCQYCEVFDMCRRGVRS